MNGNIGCTIEHCNGLENIDIVWTLVIAIYTIHLCTRLFVDSLLCTTFAGFFMGGGLELTQDSIVYSSRDRQRIRTQASGTVHLRLSVILRNFDKFGVEAC